MAIPAKEVILTSLRDGEAEAKALIDGAHSRGDIAQEQAITRLLEEWRPLIARVSETGVENAGLADPRPANKKRNPNVR